MVQTRKAEVEAALGVEAGKGFRPLREGVEVDVTPHGTKVRLTGPKKRSKLYLRGGGGGVSQVS